METQGHPWDVSGALETAGPRIHEQEPEPVVPEHLRDMGMSANEYVRVEQIDKFLGKLVVQRPLGVVSPVTAAAETYVGHQNPKPLALESLVPGIYLPDVQAVAVAVDSDQGLECLDLRGTRQSPEITGMPDLVHRFEELFHIRGKGAVGI